MGYSSSSATLLTAIAGLHKPDGSTPTNTLANVALSAHINQGDPRDDHIRLNHRLGVLHTVSGGVDGQGSFIPDKSLNFNPAGPNAASAAWFGKKPFTAASTLYGSFYSTVYAGITLHLWVDQVAFVIYGSTGGEVATANDYAFMPYTVYPFQVRSNYGNPASSYLDNTGHTHFAIIRDTADGNVYISLPEAQRA